MGKFSNKSLVQGYIHQFGNGCEVGHLLADEDRAKVEELRPNPHYHVFNLHHIFHPFQQRKDLWSNIIWIDSTIHQPWGHDKNPIELTIVCLYAKWDKGEFDRDELRECLGSCPVAWLEYKGMAHVGPGSIYYDYCLEIREGY